MAASEHTSRILTALLSHPNYAEFESNISRTPYDLSLWWTYLDAVEDETAETRWFIAERAVASLPGSYKLWRRYLLARVQASRDAAPSSPLVQALNDVFERALTHLSRMPRLWIQYLDWLVAQVAITAVRTAFDRALQALPITQHALIWPTITRWCDSGLPPDITAVHLYRRYTQIQPAAGEHFVKFLLRVGAWDEAATTLAGLLSDPKYKSPHGATRRELWMQLCDVLAQHPAEVRGIVPEQAIRSAIAQFSADAGRLWCALADSWVRTGAWEHARDVYEEALAEVLTVRDFAMVFDAYTAFEETLIQAAAAAAADGDGSSPSAGAAASGGLPLAPAAYLSLDVSVDDIELRLHRLEALMDRRPLLLSSVMLRQNPHHVAEWVSRAALYRKAGRHGDAVRTFQRALDAVDPARAVGGTMTHLWQSYAQLHEQADDASSARAVFARACASTAWKRGTDLATTVCAAAEFELRQGDGEAARRVLAAGVAPASRHGGDALSVRRDGAARSARDWAAIDAKLWGMFCDVEEALGTVDNVRAAYDAALTAHVATVAMVLNYTAYLQERGYHEAAFQAYERAVQVFAWPAVLKLWQAYTTAFLSRYGGAELERARELFETAVHAAPADCAKSLYLAYATMEEQHGRARAGLTILRRAAEAVQAGDKSELWLLAAKRASAVGGPTAARPMYEAALNSVPDGAIKEVATHFIALERSLGEVDRARALYTYAAQFTDPRLDEEWWASWKAFEVENGNPETFKDMLRVKRSVTLKVSTLNYSAAQVTELSATAQGDRKDTQNSDAGKKRARDGVAFVRAEGGQAQAGAGKSARAANPEEIDVDAPAVDHVQAPEQSSSSANIAPAPAQAPADDAAPKRPRY